MFLLLAKPEVETQGDQMHQWKQAQFEAATPEGRLGVRGLVYRGLGLECITDDAGGVWYDDWDVTHIASGTRIGTIIGLDEEEAFKLATVIADVTDWTSGRLLSGLGRDSELATRLLMLADLAGGAFVVAGLDGPAPRAVVHDLGQTAEPV